MFSRISYQVNPKVFSFFSNFLKINNFAMVGVLIIQIFAIVADNTLSTIYKFKDTIYKEIGAPGSQERSDFILTLFGQGQF